MTKYIVHCPKCSDGLMVAEVDWNGRMPLFEDGFSWQDVQGGSHSDVRLVVCGNPDCNFRIDRLPEGDGWHIEVVIKRRIVGGSITTPIYMAELIFEATASPDDYDYFSPMEIGREAYDLPLENLLNLSSKVAVQYAAQAGVASVSVRDDYSPAGHARMMAVSERALADLLKRDW